MVKGAHSRPKITTGVHSQLGIWQRFLCIPHNPLFYIFFYLFAMILHCSRPKNSAFDSHIAHRPSKTDWATVPARTHEKTLRNAQFNRSNPEGPNLCARWLTSCAGNKREPLGRIDTCSLIDSWNLAPLISMLRQNTPWPNKTWLSSLSSLHISSNLISPNSSSN